ncbi:hypothetical protein IQ251_13740 [Saccharopolyspora sp. HNM0983]|uniref:Uncharacterized protein n=1 Tax=Saccharopolyspora montiporae TaxID=2781240 RepID=A0A929BB42_9PSEU|nr:hypothetical protein [Saccharopolyspora sp. HNM0983]MBE9375510.1 hypothetical protein [Saccharopolyspora sp. HNM0983]
MIEDRVSAPAGAASLLPVLTALETARSVRLEVDALEFSDADEVSRVRHQVAMLRHWLQLGHAEGVEYSALLDGLDEFAERTDARLAGRSG